MKLLNKTIIITFSIFLLSCDEFLTKAPETFLAIENFYQNTNEINQAVIGCYSALVEIHNSGEYIFNEDRSDNSYYGHSSTLNVSAFFPGILQVQPVNTYVSNYWARTYDLISRVNVVLKFLDVVDDEMKKNQFEAEVKYLRAWCYFNLVRYFGDVPLITEPITTGEEAKKIGRTKISLVYEQIVQDLKDSYNLFVSADAGYSPKYGQATKWAASALLGKVYLTLGETQNALSPLEVVYNGKAYKLVVKYPELFVEALETSVASQEVIFPIRFQTGGVGLSNTYSKPVSTGWSAFGDGAVNYTDDLFKVFVNTTDTATDTRFRVTIENIPNLRNCRPKRFGMISDGKGGYIANQIGQTDEAGLDWPDLRFADVVLMLAEVKGISGGGLNLLNEVRARAKAPLYTQNDINNRFGGNFREAVLNERRLEMAFENKRFFDLVRIGDDYATAMLYKKYSTEPKYSLSSDPELNGLVMQVIGNGKVDSWRLLLPIPLNQILRSDALKQNAGYE
jgi:starch-binding outer membrane protein, SusD/RagB family